MEKQKSLDFLNKCLDEIKSLSQVEFDRIVIEKGLNNESIDYSLSDLSFEILFNNPTQLNAEYSIPFEYSTPNNNSLGEISISLPNNINLSNKYYLIAA